MPSENLTKVKDHQFDLCEKDILYLHPQQGKEECLLFACVIISHSCSFEKPYPVHGPIDVLGTWTQFKLL